MKELSFDENQAEQNQLEGLGGAKDHIYVSNGMYSLCYCVSHMLYFELH